MVLVGTLLREALYPYCGALLRKLKNEAAERHDKVMASMDFSPGDPKPVAELPPADAQQAS
jgi:hypothetical protein